MFDINIDLIYPLLNELVGVSADPIEDQHHTLQSYEQDCPYKTFLHHLPSMTFTYWVAPAESI